MRKLFLTALCAMTFATSVQAGGLMTTTYYAIGQTAQDYYAYEQCVGITLSYNFNASRSKYKGTGAGNDEKSRL